MYVSGGARQVIVRRGGEPNGVGGGVEQEEMNDESDLMLCSLRILLRRMI